MSTSAISATGPPGEPLARFLDALQAIGWVTAKQEAVAESGGPNPTRLDLRHGQDQKRLLVYSWFITGEGKGRTKKDFRIQTTRTHNGPLASEPGRVTVGIGWDRRREVFAAFDGWTKRQTGGSSSVHFKADTLDRAVCTGWAVEAPRWDARAAFRPANAGEFLKWIGQMSGLREGLLDPLDYTIHDDDHAEIVGDIWGGRTTGWLRIGDRVVIIDKDGGMLNDTLWRIVSLDAQQVPTASGRYNRTRVTFSCIRIGRIKDEAALEQLR